MDVSQRIEQKETLKLDAELVNVVVETPLQEINTIIEEKIEEGVFEVVGEDIICENCGSPVSFGVTICPVCNQDQNSVFMNDGDENEESFSIEDTGIFFDEDPWPEDRGVEEEFLGWSVPSFDVYLMEYVRSMGIGPDEARCVASVVKKFWSKEEPIPSSVENISDDFSCAELFKRPELQQDALEALYYRWLEEVDLRRGGPSGEREAAIEVRRIGDELHLIVHDRSEWLTVNPLFSNTSVRVGEKEFPASKFLTTVRKRNRNLKKILHIIVDKRKEFFLASSREEAMAILDEVPFEQEDIVRKTGLDKGIVSKYFSKERIKTPHGTFLLRDLLRKRARSSEDISQAKINQERCRRIRELIEYYESLDPPRFLSDKAIADIFLKRYGDKLTGRQVTNIRKEYGIPSARERRKNYIR